MEVTAAPTIDGDLSDPAWSEAARAETFSDQFNFDTGIDQTEAWLCYDAEAIYVAFRCRDSQPDSIVGREIRRDARFQGEDTVTFMLDPYRTRRGDGSNWFITNCLGTPASYIAGGRAGKTEWKGEWEARSRRVEDGWTAEMRIPWRILNFPARVGPTTMGVNFMRRQERTKILSYWSNVGPQSQNELAGDWEEVRVPRSLFKREVSFLPYTTSGFNLTGGTGFDTGLGRNKTLNFGLDARAALTPELTAVGSLNPDFSTVERAIEGIDFTRGERFVPDTRPFFLEGEDVFSVTRSSGRGWGDAFFSGRVPAFDAGMKVFGRYGPKDSVGFLGAVNLGDRRGDVVGRWSHDVGPASWVGAYLVQRSLPGDSNTVLGLNESIQKGPWQLRSDLATSFGRDAGGQAANVGVRWEKDRLRMNLAYNYVAPDFRAANGFVRFRDYHGPDFWGRYRTQWRSGPVRELNLWVNALEHRRTDGSFFRRTFDLGGYVETLSDWSFFAGWEGGQFLNEDDSEFSVGVTRNVSNRYNRMGLRYSFGKRANEPIAFIAPTISRRVFGKWDVSLSSGILRHTESRTQHVIGLAREFDALRALGGRIIWRDGRFHYFLSYRVSGGRGMETFFLLGDPESRGRSGRTFFITKFVFPVSL